MNETKMNNELLQNTCIGLLCVAGYIMTFLQFIVAARRGEILLYTRKLYGRPARILGILGLLGMVGTTYFLVSIIVSNTIHPSLFSLIALFLFVLLVVVLVVLRIAEYFTRR